MVDDLEQRKIEAMARELCRQCYESGICYGQPKEDDWNDFVDEARDTEAARARVMAEAGVVEVSVVDLEELVRIIGTGEMHDAWVFAHGLMGRAAAHEQEKTDDGQLPHGTY